jgi:hypothetical protein
MEPEGSLPCSQGLSIVPYFEPDEFSPYHLILFLYDPFLAYFPYFEKIKVVLWDHVAVCMCVYIFPPIVARQPLRKRPLIVARQRLGKNPPIVARQQLGRNVTAVTNTLATIEELLEASFSMWPVSYKEK